MLTVDEAMAAIVAHAGRQPIVNLPLLEASGLVLAEDILSDIDSPPFSKALMDGYAVCGSDLEVGATSLVCLGEVAAGTMSRWTVEPGSAVRVMTGAPMPEGADSVVMVERSELLSDGRVRLDDRTFKRGQNVMPRGRELLTGGLALTEGTKLGPVQMGVLATVGCPKPRVYSRPTIAIVSTGSELVAPDSRPIDAQIRNSNETMLATLSQQAGCVVRCLGIVADTESQLRERILDGLQSDILLLSGGVSAGKFDLAPKVFSDLGIECVFHKVQFKPGKPLWFGKHKRGIVFGLPGNPVSVLACFCLFVRTALAARSGMTDPQPKHRLASLAESLDHAADRLTYHPAFVDWAQFPVVVKPLPWFGSSDLKALANANAFLVIAPGATALKAGTPVHVLPF